MVRLILHIIGFYSQTNSLCAANEAHNSEAFSIKAIIEDP